MCPLRSALHACLARLLLAGVGQLVQRVAIGIPAHTGHRQGCVVLVAAGEANLETITVEDSEQSSAALAPPLPLFGFLHVGPPFYRPLHAATMRRMRGSGRLVRQQSDIWCSLRGCSNHLNNSRLQGTRAARYTALTAQEPPGSDPGGPSESADRNGPASATSEGGVRRRAKSCRSVARRRR